MSVSIINPGVGGITVETDPTALKLTGGTLSGKLIGTATATNAAISVGTLTANPTSLSNGDIWIVDRLNFVNRLGNTIGVVTTNQASTIATTSTGNVIQIDQNGSGGGLLVRSLSTGTNLACVRIEQRGTGNALVVEDEANVDANPFTISNNGRVGIGVTPDITAALRVDDAGIKFGNIAERQTIPYHINFIKSYAEATWLAHNFRTFVTSASYDNISGLTTVYHNSPIVDALMPAYVTEFYLNAGGGDYPVYTYGTGVIQFDVDVTSASVLWKVQGIYLTGSETVLY